MNSAAKVLNVLELFLNNREELVLGDIVKESGLSRTTAHRMITILVKHGFLKQKKKRGKYSLGIRSLKLNEFREKTDSHRNCFSYYISELSQMVGESVFLAMWYKNEVIANQDSDYSKSYIKMLQENWHKMHLHSTCMGKIILAGMSNDNLKTYFNVKNLEKITLHTIVDLKTMKEQLRIINREGIAFEYEENALNMNGIAAAIKNLEGELIGAIYLIGDSNRLNRAMLAKNSPALKTCAQKISVESENLPPENLS